MEHAYRLIISEFCTLVQHPDVDGACNEGSFEVEGVTFAFACRETLDAEAFLLIADVGTITDESSGACHQLLTRSLSDMLARGGCFTISSASGAVLHMQRFPIRQTTPQKLVEQLQITLGLVRHARESILSIERV
ncbi:MAG: CesT family type III secretion system chaperone [Polaromonas sp.]|nr:CesT family type III secretion system chaperone [Polaromonas sp.]